MANWLVLWGQVRTNAALRAAHKAIYIAYRRAAEAHGLDLNETALASDLSVSLGGIWLQRGLDPGIFDHVNTSLRTLAAHGIALDV